MKKREIIMYEMDDCFGKLWCKNTKYTNLYMAYPTAPGKVNLIPFTVGAKVLRENGSFGDNRYNLRNHGLGGDFYYYIEDVEETKDLRESLKYSEVELELDENGLYKIKDRLYFVIKSLTHRLSKTEIYKMRALGLNLSPVNITNVKGKPVMNYSSNKNSYHLLSISDINRIRKAGLSDKLLAEENFEIYRQNEGALTKITLEDVFGPQKNPEPKKTMFYEFDPLHEKNPGYGDTVEFEASTTDENGNLIYKMAPKILQHDSHFEYALRVKSKNIRTFNMIPEGKTGQSVLNKIRNDGKEDNLKTFIELPKENTGSTFRYFIEEPILSKTKDEPKKLELKTDK